MCDNMMEWTGETRHPIDPRKVLRGADKEDLKDALVIGVRGNGSLFIAASNPDPHQMLSKIKVVEMMIVRTLEEMFDGDQ